MLCVVQVSNSQSLDDVVEYFTGIDQGLSRPGQGVFKPGWEVCLLSLQNIKYCKTTVCCILLHERLWAQIWSGHGSSSLDGRSVLLGTLLAPQVSYCAGVL